MHSPTPDRTPASLLERVRRTDDAASWAQFVALYAPLLLTWLRRLRVPEPDRPDHVQEVFVKLVARLPAFRYDPAMRFRGFLFRLTRNQVIPAARGAPPAALPLIDVPEW